MLITVLYACTMDLKQFNILFCLTLLLSKECVAKPCKGKKKFCYSDSDCGKNRVCRRSMCRKIKTAKELLAKSLNISICVSNEDCQATFFCNAKSSQCEKITQPHQVVRKQKCESLKASCRSDDDCQCSEKKLVCVQKECVYASNNLVPDDAACKRRSDCNIGFLCKNGICKEDQSWAEYFLPECLTDSECHEGDYCRDTWCEEKPFMNWEKCAQNHLDKRCSTQRECNKCGQFAPVLTCIENRCKYRKTQTAAG